MRDVIFLAAVETLRCHADSEFAFNTVVHLNISEFAFNTVVHLNIHSY